jgi:hypothetical protein
MDEDTMDQNLVAALRARNVDVVTALEGEMIERDDAEHLDYATDHGRVLCAFNIRDYYRLHSEYLSQGKPYAGMILMRQQYYSVDEQSRRLLHLLASKSAEEMVNWVEFLSAWGAVSR